VFSGNVHYQDILAAEARSVRCRSPSTAVRLTESQRNVVASLAASAAVAARNAIRRRERDEAQQSTILALAKLAEQRDNETGKHLERVSEFCRLIAAACATTAGTASGSPTSGSRCSRTPRRSHDIGKVGIPDSILLKPGKLTPDEWTVMKRHTEIGAETLRSVMSAARTRPSCT
jgi:response regulator RpfG family c-di-GMP phosphodiesterase